MTPKETVQKFIEMINLHDVGGIIEMLTDDHLFIDAWGNRFEGKKTMTEGWRAYFEWFPDYKIDIEEIIGSCENVFIFGGASATYPGSPGINAPDRRWSLPAAWRAIVLEDKIRKWQVYADTKKPFDILEKYSSPPPLN